VAKKSSRRRRRSRKGAPKGKPKKKFDMLVEVNTGPGQMAPLYACMLKVTKITPKSGR
jgi:hypothetical protein